LDLPAEVFLALRRSPEEFGRELRLAAAIHWYQRDQLSQEMAAQVAGSTDGLPDGSGTKRRGRLFCGL
jgi:Uncharacterised protein family (UPF0175)